MQEFKFRGKRVDNEEWVFGYYFKTPLTDENSGTDSSDGWFFLADSKERHCISQDNTAFVVDPTTIGQYIGKPDKNGIDLYTGDILQDDVGHLFEVMFGKLPLGKSGDCVCTYDAFYAKGYGKVGEALWHECQEIGDWMEKIGTVYENAGLLGK